MKFLLRKRFIFPAFLLFVATTGMVVGLFVLQESIFPTILRSSYSHETLVGTNYDFNRLVVLVDEYNGVSEKTRARFGQQRRPMISADYVDEIIKAAAHEKVCLQNHLWLLEAHSTYGLSLKKKQSLLYYMRIADNIIKKLKLLKSGLSK